MEENFCRMNEMSFGRNSPPVMTHFETVSGNSGHSIVAYSRKLHFLVIRRHKSM
jgi:hypothetical protein